VVSHKLAHDSFVSLGRSAGHGGPGGVEAVIAVIVVASKIINFMVRNFQRSETVESGSQRLI
jgi:hypothetical protein